MSHFRLVIVDYAKEQLENPTAQKFCLMLSLRNKRTFCGPTLTTWSPISMTRLGPIILFMT